jgi:hypothetical protein
METATDYEERRAFCDSMKKFTRPEYIEIARILHRNGVAMSENRSGLYVDMSKVPNAVFKELQQFREFVAQSTSELAKRDDLLRDLKESGTQEE